MTEAELIKKIKTLREIKPRKDWVLLTKSQILGDVEVRPQHFLFPFFKPAYAGVFVVLFLIGLFEFSQSALPGEPLYFVKRASEKAVASFTPQEQKSRVNLESANKRLEELNQIAQNNEVKKLAPAMNEFQANVSEAAKNLANVKKVDQGLIAQTQKLEENKEKVEKVLATKIETEEYDNALSQLVEREIQDLEERTLNEEQTATLQEAKADFEVGNYSEALIKILSLSQNNK
jgi:hypothetical protein